MQWQSQWHWNCSVWKWAPSGPPTFVHPRNRRLARLAMKKHRLVSEVRYDRTLQGKACHKLDGGKTLHPPTLCEGAVRKSIHTGHHYLARKFKGLRLGKRVPLPEPPQKQKHDHPQSPQDSPGLVLQLFGQSTPGALHIPALFSNDGKAVHSKTLLQCPQPRR